MKTFKAFISESVTMHVKDLHHIETHINGGEQVDHYKKQIQNKQPIKPIQLVKIDGNDKLHLQDGNHRLTAFRELGVKHIPVQVLHVDHNMKMTDITHKYK